MSSFVLNSVELKALSVSASLKFLLCVEAEIALCSHATEKGKPITIVFPPLGDAYRNLLELCAQRFKLTTRDDGPGSVVFGVASAPLLSYLDYLPGKLTQKELFDALDVTPITVPKEGENADGQRTFIPSFIDYSPYATDATLEDVCGLGFYLTLDCGLSLASHGHLVEVQLHKGWNAEKVIDELKEFSGWSQIDFRAVNPSRLNDGGGVLVFPSIQDVSDLLEKYEDEDSDEDGDVLPFVLRPVAPLAPVPCVEDSALRKLRDQHWNAVIEFWERYPSTRNTVVVFNLYPQATLKEILAFVEDLPIEQAFFLEDDSPYHKGRVFITFSNMEAARKALNLDGRSTRGRTLRVQVAPPYSSSSRRGKVTEEFYKNAPKRRKPEVEKPAKVEPAAAPSAKGKKEKEKEKEQAPEREKEKAPDAGEKKAEVKIPSHPPPPRYDQSPSLPPYKPLVNTSPSLSSQNPSMNASAKEFVPQFHMKDPPVYTPRQSTPMAPPPPPPPPPPAYADAVVSQPVIFISPAVPVIDPTFAPAPFMLPPNALMEGYDMSEVLLPPPPPPPPPPPR